MPVEQQDILHHLYDKVQRLVETYEAVKTERDTLRVSLSERDTLVNHLNNTVSNLEEKNKKLQLADAFKVSSEDTRDAKLKIGRIVREIDKCMALLNK